MLLYLFLRLWTGYDKDDELLEGYVYITETGNVYHTFRDCSHLALSITSIPKEDIKDAKNESGEAYVNCPMCLEIVEKEEQNQCKADIKNTFFHFFPVQVITPCFLSFLIW